jgi:hypothetical protein
VCDPNACPGAGQATANVGCAAGACTFSCKGEQYDVDGDAITGCEVVDTPTGNHNDVTAIDLGAFPCIDAESAQNIAGRMPSDGRTHENPSLAGLDASSGAAPDWYRLRATGGTFCNNDLDLTLAVTASAFPTCYRLLVVTSVGPTVCTTTATGACQILLGSGSYGDDTDIGIRVDKTCSLVMTEDVAYTITGHL